MNDRTEHWALNALHILKTRHRSTKYPNAQHTKLYKYSTEKLQSEWKIYGKVNLVEIRKCL